MAANPAGKHWATVLAAAKQALPEVAAEPGVSAVHAELAPILCDMAVGLVEEARQAKTSAERAALAAQAADALALAGDGRLVPGALRPWQRLAEAQDALAILQHGLDRDRALAAFSASLSAAVASPET